MGTEQRLPRLGDSRRAGARDGPAGGRRQRRERGRLRRGPPRHHALPADVVHHRGHRNRRGPGPGRGDLPRPDGHGRRARTHDRGPARAAVRLREPRLPGGRGLGQRPVEDGTRGRRREPGRPDRPDRTRRGRRHRAHGDVRGPAGRPDGAGHLHPPRPLARHRDRLAGHHLRAGGGDHRRGCDPYRRPAPLARSRGRPGVRLRTAGPGRASGTPGDVRGRGRHDRGRAARPGRMPTASPAASRTDH